MFSMGSLNSLLSGASEISGALGGPTIPGATPPPPPPPAVRAASRDDGMIFNDPGTAAAGAGISLVALFLGYKALRYFGVIPKII